MNNLTIKGTNHLKKIELFYYIADKTQRCNLDRDACVGTNNITEEAIH